MQTFVEALNNKLENAPVVLSTIQYFVDKFPALNCPDDDRNTFISLLSNTNAYWKTYTNHIAYVAISVHNLGGSDSSNDVVKNYSRALTQLGRFAESLLRSDTISVPVMPEEYGKEELTHYMIASVLLSHLSKDDAGKMFLVGNVDGQPVTLSYFRSNQGSIAEQNEHAVVFLMGLLRFFADDGFNGPTEVSRTTKRGMHLYSHLVAIACSGRKKESVAIRPPSYQA
jgi:hypothetical protein